MLNVDCTVMKLKTFLEYVLTQSDTAALRGIKPTTVASHLADCIRVGFPVDLERLDVTDDVEKLIVDVIRKPPINSGNSVALFLMCHSASNRVAIE